MASTTKPNRFHRSTPPRTNSAARPSRIDTTGVPCHQTPVASPARYSAASTADVVARTISRQSQILGIGSGAGAARESLLSRWGVRSSHCRDRWLFFDALLVRSAISAADRFRSALSVRVDLLPSG